MTAYLNFALELALPLTFGIGAFLLLRTVLVSVLTDICGTASRAQFWSRFTQLMLIIGPLLTMLLLGDANIDVLNAAQLRATFRDVLVGLFVTLAGIGAVIWRAALIQVQPTATPANGAETKR